MERLSKDRLSALTGCSYRTIVKRLAAAGVEPVERDGRVELFAAPAALRAILAPVGPSPDALKAARLREHEARAEALELETARKRGELMPVADCRAGATRAGLTIRDAMLSIPGRIAAELVAMEDERDVERRLTDELRVELTRLARSVERPEAGRTADA